MENRSSLRRRQFSPIDRRRFVQAVGIAAIGGAVLPGTLAAHQSTPAATAVASPAHDHADGPMPPDMMWTWTDDGADVPTEITAGWNHVVVVNNRSTDVHVFTLRVPDEITMEQVATDLALDGSFPDWVWQAYYPGIPDHATPGDIREGYSYYPEGRYVWMDIASGVNGIFSATTGSFNRMTPLPDVHLGMVEMTYMGLDAPLKAGQQMWEVANHGATWHEVMVLQTPELMTVDEVIELILSTENADILPEEYIVRGGYGVTSPGSSGYVMLDLPAGTYAAICFVPDNFEGVPHAIMGMITPFTVE